MKGLLPNSDVQLTSAVVAVSNVDSEFELTMNGVSTIQRLVLPLTDKEYIKGIENVANILIHNVASESVPITLTYHSSSNNSIGYLNYLELNFKKELKVYDNQTMFRSPAAGKGIVSQFIIKDAPATGIRIWDVTSTVNCFSLNYTVQDGNIAFNSSDANKEFIAFQGSDFAKPSYVGKVANQDLHAVGAIDIPDMVVVTTEVLESSAKRLASFRENHDHLKVAVVTATQVYNEFSSGAQDLSAIRNFMKYLYDQGTSSDSVRFLLLFGAASYDYKNRNGGNANTVPIYETPVSLHTVQSQSSYDYCGFLDDDEGALSLGIIKTLDIGIGRLPVRSIHEADQMVDKLIHYSTSQKTLGKWRNRICLLADNADRPSDGSHNHMGDAESMATMISAKNPAMNVNKLYMDAFPLISSPSGQICPSLKDALLKEIDKGALIFNYSGHGSEFLLSQENMLNMSDINNLRNYDRLPFFITATCEFGRYDDPAIFSGAMSLVLNPAGGAIGMFASTRPVYAISNETINRTFYNQVFEVKGNSKPRLGEIIMHTKNNEPDKAYNLNYTLLGDPSMILAFPAADIVITSMNDLPLTDTSADTLHALDNFSISGEIRENGRLNTDYNGTVFLSIFDKNSVIYTIATSEFPSRSFELQNSLIFEGTASVTQGKFHNAFIVSKDISYTYGKGKISMYSTDGEENDAAGYYTSIVVGGSASNAIMDTTGPEIRLFMDDTTFVSGGLTSSNTNLVALLSDESGINISNAGIGHDITCILNDNTGVISLNDYYTANKNNYKRGKVVFPFAGLVPGNHTVRIKAWDAYNNSSERSIDFQIVGGDQPQLSNAFNYPNPFSTLTTFQFDHNRAGEDLEVRIEIYSMTGHLVKTLESKIVVSGAHISEPSWDGRAEGGQPLEDGVYIYTIRIRFSQDGSEVNKHHKLVIMK